MGIEIERKFLLSSDEWKRHITGSRNIIQGYLTENAGKASVRVRLDGDKANINIKSRELAITRQEYEYAIPVDDARTMLETLCDHAIVKVRHHVEYEGHLWEVDVFEGDNAGLVVAEIELGNEDDHFVRADWLGEEVSHDVRYYNVNLISHPYSQW